MAEAKELYASYIANCVFNVYLSYTAIMLNSVTIQALRKAASLPKPLKTLLLSLTVSDLGVGLIVQPLQVAFMAMELTTNTQNSSTYNTTYNANLTTGSFFVYTSFLGVMALSADRFLAVHLHLRYHEIVTQKRVVAAVISIWLFSTFASFIELRIPRNIRYAILAVIVVSCLLTTTSLYYRIYVTATRHANQITEAQQVQQTPQNGRMENASRMRKFVTATFFVYLAFLVCYLPNICSYVIVIISGTTTTVKGWRLYTVTLVYLNSSLNPLIYCWKMRHIRHAFINTLRNVFCMKPTLRKAGELQRAK